MQDVHKVGPLILVALLVLAGLFAFLPAGEQTTPNIGATLHGVRLTLYPTRDPGAIWQFQAAKVVSDPVAGLTQMSGLGVGERRLRPQDSAQHSTENMVLDATITTPSLTIDAQDNLLTSRARLNMVRECAVIDLTGDQDKPVRIEQGVGFSAPHTKLDAPGMQANVRDLKMDFNFQILAAGPMDLLGELDSKERCVDGRRVTAAS